MLLNVGVTKWPYNHDVNQNPNRSPNFRARKSICETVNRLFWKVNLLTCFQGNKRQNDYEVWRQIPSVLDTRKWLVNFRVLRETDSWTLFVLFIVLVDSNWILFGGQTSTQSPTLLDGQFYWTNFKLSCQKTPVESDGLPSRDTTFDGKYGILTACKGVLNKLIYHIRGKFTESWLAEMEGIFP